MKNVIRSMSSISIDHMGFFTWALTSIVFDHIVDTRQTSQETREMCPVYHRNTQHYWWGYKPNLILEESDVTHDVKKRKIKCLHVLHYFQTQSNSSFICFYVFFFISRLVLGPYQRVMKEKQKDWSQRVARVVLHICWCTHTYIYIYFFLFPRFRVCIYDVYVYCSIDIYMYTYVYINILNVQYSYKYI